MKRSNRILGFTVISFFVGLFAGVILVNLSCKYRAAEDILLNRSMLLQIPLLDIRQKKLFEIIVQSRLKWFALFGLLVATPLAHRTMYLFAAWLGYGAGSLLTLSVIQYKALGILVFLAAVMPQAVLLVPGGLLMMNWLLKMRRPAVSFYNRKLKCVISFLVFAVIIFAGIFLECYVNPIVMRIFVKIFL